MTEPLDADAMARRGSHPDLPGSPGPIVKKAKEGLSWTETGVVSGLAIAAIAGVLDDRACVPAATKPSATAVMGSALVRGGNWWHGQRHDPWPQHRRTHFQEIVSDVMSPAERQLSPRRRYAARCSWSVLRPGSLRPDVRPHGRDTWCTHVGDTYEASGSRRHGVAWQLHRGHRGRARASRHLPGSRRRGRSAARR
jgi:hypothetical protein